MMCHNIGLPPISTFYCSRTPLALPSFPTRRSSDLRFARALPRILEQPANRQRLPAERIHFHRNLIVRRQSLRSEERTSELQLRLHLVCRLLLEKKNNLPCERWNASSS